MRELVKRWDDLHMNVLQKQNMSSKDYLSEAREKAKQRIEILRQFSDEDWEEVFSMPYPVQYKIVLMKTLEAIKAESE